MKHIKSLQEDKKEEETAKQRVDKHIQAAEKNLEIIKKILEGEKANSKPNFGHAGSLHFVNERLCEIIEHYGKEGYTVDNLGEISGKETGII